jgi:hypothetical protein
MVESVRGAPLRAVVTVRTEAQEEIRPECLSLGDETDLSQPDYPLLKEASIGLAPAGDSIEITTRNPVDRPGVSVVLRLQCPGEALTARHFNLLIRQPQDPPPTPGEKSYPSATRLTLLHDETVSSIARAVHPRNAAARRELEQAIIAANPQLFPQGRPVRLRAGTRLLLPLPQEMLASKPSAIPRPSTAAKEPDSGPEPKVQKSRERPQKLRLKLARGEPGVKRSAEWNEARREELRRLYRGEALAVAAPGTEALELKIAQLREAQNAINSHLTRLEQLIESLRRSITALLNAPPVTAAPAPKPAPLPPAPRAAPAPPSAMPWTLWAAAAAGALLLGVVAFVLGRRSQRGAVLAEHEARIDALLHEARQAAGPLLTTPAPSPQLRRPLPSIPLEPRPTPRPRAQATPPPTPEEEVPSPPPAGPASELAPPPLPELMLDTEPAPAGVDVELETGTREPELPPPADAAPAAEAQPKLQLRQEMDMAIDNSRSMFTDVDRFIALGRIHNAISLLEFQTQRDPKDRDSWVKLMAVYRQEGMETEFQRAYAQFKRQFPEEV